MDGSGFWRQVTARQAFNPPPPPHPNSPAAIQAARARAERGDTEPALPADATPLLLVFLVAKRAAAAAEVDAEMARLVEFLTGPAAMASYPMPLRLSVAVESADARGEAAAGDNAAGLQQLYGPAYIEERLHGLTYRVSPAAFFQVNTPGAEQLCELLQTVCAVGPKTVLLDVCCGTGTLGLSLARSVQKVVGVEICVPAVKDARANAGRNRVTNASFIASKAEHAIKGVLESLTDDEKANLVAIVDPPRAGLHHDVIKALRACLPLTKLIFIACHAPAFVANAAPLCRPTSTSFAGPPFAPTQAHALDLFPHTAHCELIVVLERSAPPPSEPPPSEPHAAPQPGEGSTSGTTGGGMAQESAHGTARDAAGEAEMVE
jgi:tRNA (uracil-5-)-methyltransferase